MHTASLLRLRFAKSRCTGSSELKMMMARLGSSPSLDNADMIIGEVVKFEDSIDWLVSLGAVRFFSVGWRSIVYTGAVLLAPIQSAQL